MNFSGFGSLASSKRRRSAQLFVTVTSSLSTLIAVASAEAAVSTLKSAHLPSILTVTLKTCAYTPSGLAGGGGGASVVGASVVPSGVVDAASSAVAAAAAIRPMHTYARSILPRALERPAVRAPVAPAEPSGAR